MTARRVLIAASFVATAATLGALWWLGWAIDQIDRAEQEMGW